MVLLGVLFAVLFFVPYRYRSLAGWISYRASPSASVKERAAPAPPSSSLNPQEREARRQELLDTRANDPNAQWEVAQLYYEDGEYVRAQFYISEAVRMGFLLDSSEERAFAGAVREAMKQTAD